MNKTQFALLGILTQYECSGYDIKKFIEKSTGFFWSESFGQIYPNLKRLEAKRWIRAIEGSGAGSKRTKYGITAAGQKRLVAWLEEPAEPAAERNELLLKLFFGSQVSLKTVAAHLEHNRLKNEALLKTYSRIKQEIAAYTGKSPDWPYWRMTLNYGILRARMELQWFKSARALLGPEKNKNIGNKIRKKIKNKKNIE